MRVVAFDLGDKRIGVAVSAGRLAVPHGTMERSGDADRDRAALVGLVEELGADRVVVGLPLSLDGSRGPAAVKAEAEAAALAEALPVPVELVDERLTTVAASRSLRAAGVGSRTQRRVVDQVAATVFLQAWLDGLRGPNAEPGLRGPNAEPGLRGPNAQHPGERLAEGA
jgi:putative Holliday junction resolvase